MLKVVIKYSIYLCSLFTILSAHAFELTPKAVNGVYELAIPERSAAGQTQKLQVA